MKKVLFLFGFALSVTGTTLAQGIAINMTGADPDSSAMLDVAASTKGFLLPRLTTLQRDSISHPSPGLLIYNIDTRYFNYFADPEWLVLSATTSTSAIPIVRTYTSNTTWTKPLGLKYIVVEMVGGGGGGGGCQSYGGSGGAGSGYTRKNISANNLNQIENITVGSGGQGGNSGINGSTGGTSSFGNHCSATGGQGGFTQGGSFGETIGSIGGTGIDGDINISGQGTSGVVSASKPQSCGGSSFFGGGAAAISYRYTSNGIDAGNYGSGGSGSICPGTLDKKGGNGSSGIVIITEYY